MSQGATALQLGDILIRVNDSDVQQWRSEDFAKARDKRLQLVSRLACRSPLPWHRPARALTFNSGVVCALVTGSLQQLTQIATLPVTLHFLRIAPLTEDLTTFADIEEFDRQHG